MLSFGIDNPGSALRHNLRSSSCLTVSHALVICSKVCAVGLLPNANLWAALLLGSAVTCSHERLGLLSSFLCSIFLTGARKAVIPLTRSVHAHKLSSATSAFALGILPHAYAEVWMLLARMAADMTPNGVWHINCPNMSQYFGYLPLTNLFDANVGCHQWDCCGFEQSILSALLSQQHLLGCRLRFPRAMARQSGGRT